jgi:hypothetical protein
MRIKDIDDKYTCLCGEQFRYKGSYVIHMKTCIMVKLDKTKHEENN